MNPIKKKLVSLAQKQAKVLNKIQDLESELRSIDEDIREQKSKLGFSRNDSDISSIQPYYSQTINFGHYDD